MKGSLEVRISEHLDEHPDYIMNKIHKSLAGIHGIMVT